MLEYMDNSELMAQNDFLEEFLFNLKEGAVSEDLKKKILSTMVLLGGAGAGA